MSKTVFYYRNQSNDIQNAVHTSKLKTNKYTKKIKLNFFENYIFNLNFYL